MENGYIKLHRKLLSSRVFQNEGLLKVWIWCLLRANHSGKWVSIMVGRTKTEVWVEPGTFIFGRKSAAKELKMPESSIRNRMAKLKKMQNVDIKVDSNYSIIIIINWDTYQASKNNKDSEEDSRRTAVGQPEDTNKNDKKEKNEKKIYGEFKNVKLSDDELKKLKTKFKDFDGRIESLSGYVASTGRKYRSHYATILNWSRKEASDFKSESSKMESDLGEIL